MQNAEFQNLRENLASDQLGETSFAVQEEGGTWRINEQSTGSNLRERTTQYARRIIRLYVALAKNTLSDVLGKQLLRSGTSVGANYRECCRGRSKAEFIAKLGDCLRELDESAYWLELIAAEELLPVHLLAPLRDETHQLISIFVASLNRSKSPD